MAILLGAFLIQGLTPGPEMLTAKLPITFGMMWQLVVANIVAALLLMVLANQLQRIIFIPSHLVVPAITLFVFMGAWTGNGQIGDWITILIFGVVGIFMKLGGWPRAPMILGFILGPIMENSLHLSVKAYGMSWLGRPIVLALIALTVLTLVFAVRSHLKQRRDASGQAVSDAEGENPALSLGVSLFIFACCAYAVGAAFAWPDAVRRWPHAIAVPTLVLCAVVLARDARLFGGLARRLGGVAAAVRPSSEDARAETRRTVVFYGWLAAIVVVTLFLGQQVALAAFMLLFLVVWARFGWTKSLVYAAVGWAFLYGIFDRLVHINWYPSLLLG
jgi:hypothetical protein